MRRFLCWIGRHDYWFKTVSSANGLTEHLRLCDHCARVWRRVRFDMDIYWDRISLAEISDRLGKEVNRD